MANSKKSISKVVAIAMASAMAMSSLSAALVNVSAVQEPALAANGSVSITSWGEDSIVAALRTGAMDTATVGAVGDNKEIDTVVGNQFDLTKVFTDAFYEKNLEYTDNDGLKADSINVTKVTYRVSAGGNNLTLDKDGNNNATILRAKKAGTATLQIKVTADVELGGGKSDKEVTLTHNVTVNVHDNAEIGLAAFDSATAAGEDRLTSTQLNDLAAYNSDNLYFQLVTFLSKGTGVAGTNVATNKTIDNTAFAAKIQKTKMGDTATTERSGVDTAAVEAQLGVQLPEAVKSALNNVELTDAAAVQKALIDAGLNTAATVLVPAQPYTYQSAQNALADATDVNLKNASTLNGAPDTLTLYRTPSLAVGGAYSLNGTAVLAAVNADNWYFTTADASADLLATILVGNTTADKLLTPVTLTGTNRYVWNTKTGITLRTEAGLAEGDTAITVYDVKSNADLTSVIETPAITGANVADAADVISGAAIEVANPETTNRGAIALKTAVSGAVVGLVAEAIVSNPAYDGRTVDATLQDSVKAALTYDAATDTLTLDWKALKGANAIAAVAATEAQTGWKVTPASTITNFVKTAAIQGYKIEPVAHSAQQKAAVAFTKATATAAVEAKKTEAPGSGALNANTLYKAADGTYFTKPSPSFATVYVDDDGNTVTLDQVLTAGASKYYSETDGSLAEQNSGTNTVEVTTYTVKEDGELTAVYKTAQKAYQKNEWDKAAAAAIEKVAGIQTGDASVKYVLDKSGLSVTKDDNSNPYFTIAGSTSEVVAAANYKDNEQDKAAFATAIADLAKSKSLTKSADGTYYYTTTTTNAFQGGEKLNDALNDQANPAMLTVGSNVEKVVEATAGKPAVSVETVLTQAQVNEVVEKVNTPTNQLGATNVKAAVNLEDTKLTNGYVKSVRFYAGSGAELFDLENPATYGGEGKWEKGTKGGNKGYTLTNTSSPNYDALLMLSTKGTTGTASVKAYVTLADAKGVEVKEEYVLNLKTVKAVDFGSADVTVEKDGSKTIMNVPTGATTPQNLLASKSLSGYEVRTAGDVTVKGGTAGNIKADGDVTVEDGKTGDIIEPWNVTVKGGATVGNIVDAGWDVEVLEASTAGNISLDGFGSLTINDATVGSIDAKGGKVDIKGGVINGNVRSDYTITVTSDDEDEDGNPMDVEIYGNVISNGKYDSDLNLSSGIQIDNESDEGKALIKITGDVIAKYADMDNGESVKIGSSNTTGLIQIGGAVQGEHIILGGNGLVTLGAVRATDEVEFGDDDGVVVDSTLEFQGFNTGINNVSNFANVTVAEGTVNVTSPLTTTTLDVQSDTQIVLSALNVEDITGDGSIVVPVGEMTVNGKVDDNPTLTLLGDNLAVDTVAYKGDKGLSEVFDLGGLTVKAEKQTNGTYNYIVTKQELYGLKAVGKNVTVGIDQTKTVTVVADAALPQGATIAWSTDDTDVAKVEGNSATAKITGVNTGSVEVTAKIVDANGKDLGYENASFTVDVLYVDTIDVVGSEVSLDTKAKNLQVGDTYSFLVRGNSDTDNITLTYDANVVNVALAQADYNGRGALYTITAIGNGSTNVTVGYKGASSNIAIKVGGFTLDTASKELGVGDTYSFLARNVKPEEAGNVQLAYDNTVANVTLAQADYNGRGALFTVTALKAGQTDVKATYNGEEATLALNVTEYANRMTLDTASYTMPFGGSYTIGVKIESNGRQLSGEEVNAMIARGELVVRDSRTGTLLQPIQVLANGNVRITAKSTEGTGYVLFEVVQNGQVVTHASVGVTVQAGATAGGSARRSVSTW